MTPRVVLSWVFFLCLSFMVPLVVVESSPITFSPPTCRIYQSETNLDITMAHLSFHIGPTGDYYCTYSLELLGTKETAIGLGEGFISVPSFNIANFSISHYSTSLPFSKAESNNSSFYQFFLNYSLPEGSKTTVEGRFDGTFWRNESTELIYHLGIDWGTTVTIQNTRVWVDRERFAIISISPEKPSNTTLGSQIFYEWNDFSVQGFSCILNLEPQLFPYSNLRLDISYWNGTPGQDLEVLITNVGFFEIEGFIVPIPSSWFTVNVSRFLLAPSQAISVLFSISDSASPGVNGSIKIIHFKWVDREGDIFEKLDPIIIPVTVQEHPPSPFGILDLFIPAGFFFAILGSFYVVFRQKEEISKFIQAKVYPSENLSIPSTSNGFFPNSSLGQNETIPEADNLALISWNTIETKWKSILPDRELQLLEILFNNGSMNQQALADILGVSKGTMSRIISRLVVKNLLLRKRFGVSKIIMLNKDRL